MPFSFVPANFRTLVLPASRVRQNSGVGARLSGRIDLNADVGEAETAEALARERDLLAVVTSASVACGVHAGDEASLR
ncbi:MAG TPA: LamB/YcsF family protein, partial [Methylomirabilota bacterium]